MSVILERYEVEKLLGKGNFGKVFLAKDSKNGIKVAIKQMSKARLAKESHLIEYLNGEIECMRMIKSPYVMELYDVAQDKENKYMICGYCNAGNLFDYQAKMPNRVIPLEKTMEIVAQILKGLQAIHSEGYLHRDLKPENVLVENDGNGDNFRIADFGFARREEKTTGTILGTGKFMAPEIYDGNKYGYGVDMWAIGVTIYYMLNGEYPFSTLFCQSDPAPRREIMDIKAKLPFSYSENVKKTFRKLIDNCNPQTEELFEKIFSFQPEKRMNFHDLKAHPLLAKYFKQDDEFTHSSILYNKEYKGKSNAPVTKIEEGDDDEEDDGADYKSHIVPKNNFNKEIEEIEFFFQHKEFILKLSEQFRSEGKYLSMAVKFALRYNLLKFYLLDATTLYNLLKKKVMPEQARTDLNWEKFFESREFTVLLNLLKEQLQSAKGKFEDSYNDCKDNIDTILQEIPEFKESFSPTPSEKDFSEFKKSFRGTTNRANKVLSSLQNELTAKGQQSPPKLIQLRIKIFICHILNQIFKREDLNENFSFYFEWKKHQKLEEPVDTFNFETFAMWISKEDKNNLIKTIAFIMKKYFGG